MCETLVMDALFDVVDAATHEEVEIDGSPDVTMAGSAVIAIQTPNGSAVPESRGGTGSAVIAIQSPNGSAVPESRGGTGSAVIAIQSPNVGCATDVMDASATDAAATDVLDASATVAAATDVLDVPATVAAATDVLDADGGAAGIVERDAGARAKQCSEAVARDDAEADNMIAGEVAAVEEREQTTARWPPLRESFLIEVAEMGNPEFTRDDIKAYIDVCKIAKIRPRTGWSACAHAKFHKAVAERKRLYDAFELAKTKGNTAGLHLRVSEATFDEVTQLREETKEIQKTLDTTNTMVQQIYRVTCDGKAPEDFAGSAREHLAVVRRAKMAAQQQEANLREEAMHEKKKDNEDLRRMIAKSTAQVKEAKSELKDATNEYNKRMKALDAPGPKKPRPDTSESGLLRTVHVKGAGIETFAVTVTPNLSNTDLKARVAERLSRNADKMVLKLGRKALPYGKLGDVGVKNAAVITVSMHK